MVLEGENTQDPRKVQFDVVAVGKEMVGIPTEIVVEHRDKAYRQAAWLSSDERADIKFNAKEDVRVWKHLKKHPEILENSFEMRKLYASTSLRGLEHFLSKTTHQALFMQQQEVIHEVLETQELFVQSSFDVKAQMLAKVSAERSLPSRGLARKQGLDDRAAVEKYLHYAGQHEFQRSCKYGL